MSTLRAARAISLFAAFLAHAAFCSPVIASTTIDLSGEWRFSRDDKGVGEIDRWYDERLSGEAVLPGTLPAQGIGNPITVDTKWTGQIVDRSFFNDPAYAPYRVPGNIKVPFWLQPTSYFVGASWFQRDVDVPGSWRGNRLFLRLERPHWKTKVWMDGRVVGSRDSLSVAHQYELGAAVPGKHTLTIEVDNTLFPDIGENSHSITDHTQGNWNGIIGSVELRSTHSSWIDDLQPFPDWRTMTVELRGRIGALEGTPLPAAVQISFDGGSGAAVGSTPVGADGIFRARFSLGPRAPLWDEFHPALHWVRAAIPDGDSRTVSFGIRTLSTDGRDLLINGRRLFLRGTLECAANPRTGSPPVDLPSWRRFFAKIKAYGLNHVRFHSWCPPEAAFEAADSMGVYLQVEMASWPNQSTTLGDGKPVDAWIEAETSRILRAYGSHPSFAFVSACNEPGGDRAAAWLTEWISRHRGADPRHLYTSGSGWPELPENDYNVSAEPRIQHWGEGLASRINRLPPETTSDYSEIIGRFRTPVVSHEMGQWCAYPNFGEVPKYTGYLKPMNFEIFRASLAAHYMLSQAHDFLMASGRLQALCYKEDIESALRTPHMGGFQLLGLSDFPGQGTALVGVLDAFWEEKGYIGAAEFRRFCSETVPLALLGRRVFTSDETMEAKIEVSHFGAEAIRIAICDYSLVDESGRAFASGSLPPRDIPVGGLCKMGIADISLSGLPVPRRYRLVVAIQGTPYKNDWDIWVYPKHENADKEPNAPLVVSRLDETACARLKEGGAVVLMIPPELVRPDPVRGDVKLGFSSIFWNTAWTHGQAPHTLGILCDPRHPALASFPTEFCSNWQWWYPISHATPMILDGAPERLRPVVQVIDDWFTNRRLALVFEARVGGGRLLVTSIGLASGDLDPVRRQLRASLLAYASGPKFNPSVPMSAEAVRNLYSP